MIVADNSPYFASSIIPVMSVLSPIVLSMTASRDFNYYLQKYHQNVQTPYLIPPTHCS
jgi:hypothetical protein